MNLESIIARVLELTATLDSRTAFLLFIVCAVGEIGFGIPYILESVWLLIGYQFGAHVLSPSHLLVLWVAAQSGRQVGAIALYHAARLGTTPLVRLYRRGGLRFLPKLPVNGKLLDRVNMSSPFSVAFGRLVGLRIPLSLTLAVRRDAKTLSLGVLLSSIIWDAVYVAFGATIGLTAILKPMNLFLASLAALTVVYLTTYLLRRFVKRFQSNGREIYPSQGKPQ